MQLKNFRGFSDFELSFLDNNGNVRKQTLFLGQNGTGKSNVLKAIAIITSGSEAILDLLHSPDDWVKYGTEEAIITATINGNNNEEKTIVLTIPKGAARQDLLRINAASLTEIDSALEHNNRNYFVAGYGASRRYNANAEFSSSRDRYNISSRIACFYSLFNADAELNPLLSWAINLDYSSNGSNVEVIKNTLEYFLEGVTFHSIDRKNRTILFKEGSSIIKLELLGDDYKNMAAWIGDLLYRLSEVFDDLKNPLIANGILLIDEIDLHLHPKWQRKLLDFISSKLPNMQLIATTHSPLTAQQAGEGELYALVKETDKVAIVPFVGVPKNLLVHQILMSPIFGVESDESLEVQQQKEQYKTLQAKKKTTTKEKKEIEVIASQLKDRSVQRTNSMLTADDKDLLNDLKTAMINK